MAYVPQPQNADTLTVYLGHVYPGGSVQTFAGYDYDVYGGVPTFLASDVGNPIMAYQVGGTACPATLPVAAWGTIIIVNSSTNAVATFESNTLPGGFPVQLVVYRPIVFDKTPIGIDPNLWPPNYILDSSITFESSLTTRPTFNFNLMSRTGLPGATVGQPVLVIQNSPDYTGDVFGGSIDQITAQNYEAGPNEYTTLAPVQYQVQCVSWDQILTRRLLILSGGFEQGTNQQTFIGPTIQTVSLASGGTNYQVGDVLTIQQSGANGGQVSVASISGGGTRGPIASINLFSGGGGYQVATGLLTTGGNGTGATISVTAVIAAGSFSLTGAPTSILSITRNGVAQTFTEGGSTVVANITSITTTDFGGGYYSTATIVTATPSGLVAMDPVYVAGNSNSAFAGFLGGVGTVVNSTTFKVTFYSYTYQTGTGGTLSSTAAGADWVWYLDTEVLNVGSTGTPLGLGDTLVVSYDTSSGNQPAPSYNNLYAGDIVTNLAELLAGDGITVSAVQGPLVDLIQWSTQDTFDSALSSLMTYINNGQNNYWYYVTARLVLTFELQGQAVAAPWAISVSGGTDGNVLLQTQNLVTREKYGNAAWVDIQGEQGTESLPFRVVGDGMTTSFDASYPVGNVAPVLTYYPPGQFPFGLSYPQTVGNANLVSTGFDWYWTPGETTITQDSGGSGTTQIGSVSINAGGSGYHVGDILGVNEVGGSGGQVKVMSLSGSAVATVEITAGGTGYSIASAVLTTGGSGSGCKLNILGVGAPPNPMPTGGVLDGMFYPSLSLGQYYKDTAAMAERSAIEGGTGEYDVYVNLQNVLPVIAGTSIAKGIAETYASLAQQVQVSSYRAGLYSGQGITLDLPEIGAVGVYIVDQVQMSVQDMMAVWTYELSYGAIIGDWKTAFKGLTGGGGSSGAAAGGGGGGGGGSSGIPLPTVPTGTIDGSNTAFNLASTPAAGLMLFRNGVLQLQGTNCPPTGDFQILGAAITFSFAPLTGDWLLAYF